MFRRYWLPIIAVVGLILQSQAKAQEIRHNSGPSTSTKQSSARPKSDSPPGISVSVQNDLDRIAGALEAAQNKKPSPQENERAERDLAAQEKMASWVGPMFWLALLEILLTLAGVILIWRTLFHTRAAAVAAQAAVTEAQNATALSQRIGHATMRAWLKAQIQVSDITISTPPNLTALNVSISITLENIGNAPAINIRPQAWSFVSRPDGEQLNDAIKRNCEAFRTKAPFFLNGTILFPGEKFPESVGLGGYGIGVNVMRDEFEASQTVNPIGIPLYIIGCVDYTFPTDPDGHHQTRFAFSILRTGSSFVIGYEPGTIPESELRVLDAGSLHGQYAD